MKLFPLCIVLAAIVGAPAQSGSEVRQFEVVSFKYAGTIQDHMVRHGHNLTMSWKPPEFKGTRLSADASLGAIVEYACLPLVTRYRQEAPEWMRLEFYQVDAIAPAGTDLDGARAMLRTALARRLGFRYHLTRRETPVFYLVRGNGPLRLRQSVEPEPPGGSRQTSWAFRSKAADLLSFARFLSSVVGRDVIDRTGIQGRYQFDVDWSSALERQGSQDGYALVDGEVSVLGLKLGSGKETRGILIVDGANKRPTPN
jgi:uncharacterized protein (TIGR03435 family)